MSNDNFRNAVLDHWGTLVNNGWNGSKKNETLQFVLWLVDNAPAGLPLVKLYTEIGKVFRILLDAKVTGTTGSEPETHAAVEDLIKAKRIIAKEEKITTIEGAEPFEEYVLYSHNVKN